MKTSFNPCNNPNSLCLICKRPRRSSCPQCWGPVLARASWSVPPRRYRRYPPPSPESRRGIPWSELWRGSDVKPGLHNHGWHPSGPHSWPIKIHIHMLQYKCTSYLILAIVYGFEIHKLFSIATECEHLLYSGVINIHNGSIFMVSLIHKFTSSMNNEIIYYS